MPDPLFIPAPFFFLRTPHWPVGKGEHLLEQPEWKEAIFFLYETDELLREAIAIASPSLHEALQKKGRTEALAISLFNYALRMASRAIPFGLFSFVSWGHWGKDSNISLDLNLVRKRARPDMAWIFALIQKWYEDESLFPALSVRTNPLSRVTSERIFLSYIRCAEPDDKNLSQTFSIHGSKLVKAILALAQEPKEISSLCDELLSSLPILDRSKLYKMIRQLLTQQFLLPGMLPSILSFSPLEELSTHLSKVKEHCNWLDKLKSYQSIPPGQGLTLLSDLQNDMKAVVSTKTVLQVDAVYTGPQPTLSKEIGKELGEAAEILWQLSPRRSLSSAMQTYHAKFIEKYGTQRTVPLMELLSEELGLGPLDRGAASLPPKSSTAFTKQWEQWLQQKWQECLHTQMNEIILTQAIIDHLLSLSKEAAPNKQEALLSMDLFCKIIADSQEHVNKGDFLLLLTQTTWQGGSSIGRFIDLLDEQAHVQFSALISEEERLEENALFIEVSYWPKTGHHANVATQPCFRKHHLDLEAKTRDPTTLSLEDLYVGAINDRLYLTLKEGGCEVLSRVGNLLNPTTAPAPLQFLREVTLSKYQLLYPFSWGQLGENSVFLPRIRFHKTILSPAKWNLNGSLFHKELSEKIPAQFTAWADKWKLPKRCLLIHGDQQLLIDRCHPAHLQEISVKLKKRESLQFVEEIPSRWIKSERGHHLCEVAIPFLKNPIYKARQSLFPPPYLSISPQDRFRLPGSEWLFLKIYLEEEGANRFLIDQLLPFTKLFEQTSNGSFFVRYRDPDYHLRFRIHLSHPKALAPILGLLHEQALHWIERGVIRNLVLASYEREIERYGGLALIGAAERLFCADSLAVCYLLRSVLNKSTTLPEPVLRTLSALNFLKGFGLEQSEILALLNRNQGSLAELKGFRQYKNQLIELAKTAFFEESTVPRQEAQRSFHAQLKDRPKEEIYSSMLHMHCNRLGCDPAAEQRTRLYTIHTLMQLERRTAILT